MTRISICVLALAGLVLLATISGADAAVLCIGPSASGNGSGADWNNQAAMPSSTGWVRGNTYYMADGNYGTLRLNTANNGTTPITIKKAMESDHGTSTGWSSAMGNEQAVFTGVFISKNYVIFDGQTGGGPGHWTTGFGFFVNTSWQTAVTAYPAVFLGEATQAATTNVTVRHVEVEGDHGDGLATHGGQSNDGISSWGGSDNTFEYMYIHDMGRCIIIQLTTSNLLFQYNCTGPFEYDPNEHSEIASLNGNNQTFRYNLFLQVSGTGGIMFNGSNEAVYGNIFYNINNSLGSYSPGGNGCVGSKDHAEPVSNTLVYNNTYINTGTSVPFIGFYMPNHSGNVAYNNIFYGSGADPGSLNGITHDYNHFIRTHSTGARHDSTGSGNPFVSLDINSLTFANLASGTPAGLTLPSPYNVDMLARTRGADGTWDRGAVEYGAARAAVIDFNGDGSPDYVLQNAGTHQTAIWYLNNNVYVGSAYGPTLSAGWGLRGVGDFNRDGHADYGLFAPSTRQTALWYLSGPTFIGSYLEDLRAEFPEAILELFSLSGLGPKTIKTPYDRLRVRTRLTAGTFSAKDHNDEDFNLCIRSSGSGYFDNDRWRRRGCPMYRAVSDGQRVWRGLE